MAFKEKTKAARIMQPKSLIFYDFSLRQVKIFEKNF